MQFFYQCRRVLKTTIGLGCLASKEDSLKWNSLAAELGSIPALNALASQYYPKKHNPFIMDPAPPADLSAGNRNEFILIYVRLDRKGISSASKMLARLGFYQKAN